MPDHYMNLTELTKLMGLYHNGKPAILRVRKYLLDFIADNPHLPRPFEVECRTKRGIFPVKVYPHYLVAVFWKQCYAKMLRSGDFVLCDLPPEEYRDAQISFLIYLKSSEVELVKNRKE